MKLIICQFCSRTLTFLRSEEFSVYECITCNCKFVYNKNDTVMFYEIKTTIDNSDFFAICYPFVKKFKIHKIGFGNILNLDYIPDINPTNISYKIQTLLIFKND